MKQEGEILKRCGKGNPFRTPEGYFDRFHEDLMKKISGAADVSDALRLSPGSSAPRRAEAGLSCLGKTSFAVLFRNVSVYWRIAAVLVVAVSLSCFIYLQGEGSKAQKFYVHHVWDNEIIHACRIWSVTEWAGELDRLSKRERLAIQQGTPRDWIHDCAVDCEVQFEWAKPDSCLGQDFLNKALPLVESQLRKAGYRLAAVLNELFD